MRFMFIWKPGKDIKGPPSAEAHQKLTALIEAGTKAGTFLGTDGLINGPNGARVQRIEGWNVQGHGWPVYRNEGARRGLRDHAPA